ncbi:hypothetical protein NDU88_008347 [Pleurodeles waltl]|uniref:Uncharacterized protein n=1 Tax=Pleurodeles waltl TaxID=8319 RepID=A0AAV7QNG5_PLEWA|nr:hypothetical protein NDU88_008347 [Pleurodeles waltl]
MPDINDHAYHLTHMVILLGYGKEVPKAYRKLIALAVLLGKQQVAMRQKEVEGEEPGSARAGARSRKLQRSAAFLPVWDTFGGPGTAAKQRQKKARGKEAMGPGGQRSVSVRAHWDTA